MSGNTPMSRLISKHNAMGRLLARGELDANAIASYVHLLKTSLHVIEEIETAKTLPGIAPAKPADTPRQGNSKP